MHDVWRSVDILEGLAAALGTLAAEDDCAQHALVHVTRYLVSTPMVGVLVARPGMALLPCHQWSGGCCRPVGRHALTADRDTAQHC